MDMFIGAVFIITKCWEKPSIEPLTDERVITAHTNDII